MIRNTARIYPGPNEMIFSLARWIHHNIKLNLEIKSNEIEHNEYFFNDIINASYTACKADDATPAVDIQNFLSNLHSLISLKTEELIIAKIFLERFHKNSNIPIFNKNWKEITAISILNALKVAHHEHLTNSQFALAIPTFSIGAIHFMDISFEGLIEGDFEINFRSYKESFDCLANIYKSKHQEELIFCQEKVDGIIRRSQWLHEISNDSYEEIHISPALENIHIDE
ncbi:unnamed protein product [Blepharisma stoltei]|uniref:Uncharacterized protein n=1 Tax=Blepharisma stoltei TaxID=1481888 RepID=A0AAU9K1I6_9CILI|nr:unnamed protein product [Blepharisma stoltei]